METEEKPVGGVETLLVGLKDGLDAAAVAIFDDDRGLMHRSTESSAAAFWNIFRGMACSQAWGAWYRDLRTTKQLAARCSCGGGHTIHAFLLHERWVMMVLVVGPLFTGADAVMASAARLAATLLSSERAKDPTPRRGGRGAGGGEAARLGIPLWWIRSDRGH